MALGLMVSGARRLTLSSVRSPKLRLLAQSLGCCHGPTQARGRYAHWARTHLHREVLREVSRCRHAALDRMLHRPTETYAGDPEHCRELDDSPDEPGVANAWDSSAERGAFGGAPSRGA